MNTKLASIVVSVALVFAAGCSKGDDASHTNASDSKAENQAYDKAFNGVSSNSVKRKSD